MKRLDTLKVTTNLKSKIYTLREKRNARYHDGILSKERNLIIQISHDYIHILSGGLFFSSVKTYARAKNYYTENTTVGMISCRNFRRTFCTTFVEVFVGFFV